MGHKIWQAIQPKHQRRVRPASNQNGQQMVEFAMTFGMLVVLFMALLIMGWMFYVHATITGAARDGSRHLMAHPTLPEDQVTFSTPDEETTWVVTRSMPMLDWHQATVSIMPDVSQRVAGGYVGVAVQYTIFMPEFQIPLFFNGQTITLGGPVQLRALSRRSLD
jgi:hypothetical protein